MLVQIRLNGNPIGTARWDYMDEILVEGPWIKGRSENHNDRVYSRIEESMRQRLWTGLDGGEVWVECRQYTWEKM